MSCNTGVAHGSLGVKVKIKQDVINEQLQRIHDWVTANGLKLNILCFVNRTKIFHYLIYL